MRTAWVFGGGGAKGVYVFPMREIDGERFIDGGDYDNVLIELARSMGADQIIVVDLKSVGNK